MRVGKTFAFAQLVETLDKKAVVKKETVIADFDLTEDQFHRYIADLKYYYVTFHPEKELVYDKKYDVYRLVSSR